MCEGGLTMGVFQLAQKREASTPFAFKKPSREGNCTQLPEILIKGLS